MKKKDIPLAVIETFEKYLDYNNGLINKLFRLVPSEGMMLKFVDCDPDSDFYFYIYEEKEALTSPIEQKGHYLIGMKPWKRTTIESREKWVIDTEKLHNIFSYWVDVLKGYEESNISTLFDDPILKSFADGYFAEFEIIEENADVEPLNPKQILLLDEYLAEVEDKIEIFQTEENQTAVQEIKEDVADLRANLTSKPKSWVIKRLSKIWAKLTKAGTKFLKEFVSEGKKQVIKEGVKYIIEQGGNLLN